VVDSNGTIYQPNEMLALFTHYLHESRGWTGVVARSVMTTHAIDAIARKVGITVKETPVGFKHIGEIMKESDSIVPSKDGEFVLGAEESGGFTMRGHVPEKDGILACLITAEMVAAKRKTIKELLETLHRDFGVHLTRRINLQATTDIVMALKEWFAAKPPVEINGLHVHRIVETDGFKFIFHDGSWLGVRFSGTEPVVRIYLEGRSEQQLQVLTKAGESLVQSAKAKTNASSGSKKLKLASHS
jgi:phosphomannomutase